MQRVSPRPVSPSLFSAQVEDSASSVSYPLRQRTHSICKVGALGYFRTSCAEPWQIGPGFVHGEIKPDCWDTPRRLDSQDRGRPIQSLRRWKQLPHHKDSVLGRKRTRCYGDGVFIPLLNRLSSGEGGLALLARFGEHGPSQGLWWDGGLHQDSPEVDKDVGSELRQLLPIGGGPNCDEGRTR